LERQKHDARMAVMLTLAAEPAEADHFIIDTTQTKPGKFEMPVKITKPFIYRRNSMNKQAKQQKKIDPFAVPADGETYEITAVACESNGIGFKRLQIIHKGQSYPALQVADLARGIVFVAVDRRYDKIHRQFGEDCPLVVMLDRTMEYQKYSGLSHAELRKQTVGAGLELLSCVFEPTEVQS